MIEKEYPIFAFEERRRFGVSMQESRNDISILESFLDGQEIEQKPKDFTFRIFQENISEQIRRDTFSVYQVILYKNYLLIEFLREYYDYENIDKVCSVIENCNKLFIEKGDEGVKKMIKLLIKGKCSSEFLKKYYINYDLNLLFLIRYIKNPIQVEKTEQEQILKIIYKIDL